MFVDEAGFYQLSAAVRTWAPRGETPEVRIPLSYDNLSTISGITISGTARAGKLYMHIYEQPISRKEVAKFLRHVLREISGKLTILQRTSSPPGKNCRWVSPGGRLPASSSRATARLRLGFEPG
ncbi:hypothetical protein GGP63_003134 [Salinibacter ruber]|nr:hypothetical protein [Salinibacter ruber]